VQRRRSGVRRVAQQVRSSSRVRQAVLPAGAGSVNAYERSAGATRRIEVTGRKNRIV